MGYGSIYALQARFGHTSVKTTEIYLQYLTPEEAQAAKFGPAADHEKDHRERQGPQANVQKASRDGPIFCGGVS
jgi:hypothetical protein